MSRSTAEPFDCNQQHLRQAMQMADIIRKYSSNGLSSEVPIVLDRDDQKMQIPPGLVEGATALMLTGTLLLPVRRFALRAAGERLHMLADLICTTGHAIVAANAGLYVGSLYGSKEYLLQLAKVPPTADSAVAKSICQEITREGFLVDNPESSAKHGVDDRVATMNGGTEFTKLTDVTDAATSWDPREQTIHAMKLSLEHCRLRKQFEDEQNGIL